MLLKEEIKTRLHQGICNLVYTKVDGTVRMAQGTLCFDLIPVESQPKVPKEGQQPNIYSENIIRYYDTGSRGWRSFFVEHLFSIGRGTEVTTLPEGQDLI
jgi:hypothetical protein